MEWQKALVIAGAGFVAGMMNAMAGGGTMVTFPVLLWAGLGAMQANVTSTIALFPGMPLGAWAFRRHFGGLGAWVRTLAPIALIGGLAGGVLLLQTGARVFDFIVPWLLLLATLLFMSNGLLQRWLRRRQIQAQAGTGDGGGLGEPVEPEPRLRAWSFLVVAAVAVYGGYFGAGIGIMMLATLGVLGLRDINQMNALKVALALLMNVGAVVYFIAQGSVHWDMVLWLMAGSMGGYWCGSHLAQRIPASWVRSLVILIGLGICLDLFLKQWRS